MSQFLENIAQETKKARNLAYFSRYDQSKETFAKIIRDIELQMLRITDKKLKDEWNRLLEEMKSESNQIEDMICLLNDREPKPKVVKPTRQERPIETKPPKQQYFVENNGDNRQYKEQRKEQNRYPFGGREPFKKYYDDDEIDNRNKQRDRQRERERDPEKDPMDWGPRPNQPQNQGVKKPYKAPNNNNNNNNSNVNQNNVNGRRNDYAKPWQVPNQAQGGRKPPGGQGQNVTTQKQEKPTYLKSVYPDGTGPDAQLIGMLERQVIDFNLGVTFEDIAELEIAKDLLYEAVIMPLKIPDYFKGPLRKAWKGVLMFGPPGTGKTLLAKAIASIGETKFFNVTAASFASKWRGQSQKLVRILFDMARFYAPTTLFIDEIDAIAGGSDTDSNNRKVLTQLLTAMDGANSDPSEDKKVVVIGATNRPWDLDEAIRRRLQKRIYIPLPTEIGRRELFKICLKQQLLSEDVNLETIIQKTDGFSGADINNLCKQAAFMPMRKKVKEAGGFRKVQNIQNFSCINQLMQEQLNVPLTMEDFNAALKNCKPTVGSEHLDKYEKWMEEFGEKGGK